MGTSGRSVDRPLTQNRQQNAEFNAGNLAYHRAYHIAFPKNYSANGDGRPARVNSIDFDGVTLTPTLAIRAPLKGVPHQPTFNLHPLLRGQEEYMYKLS